MIITLGVLGNVKLREESPSQWEQGVVTHSGYTEQGIRVHLFKGTGWTHGEMWNNAIMLDFYFLICEGGIHVQGI